MPHQTTSPPRTSVRPNAFDLLRLVAAGMVLVEHSWVLTGHPTPLPTASGTAFGQIGVGIFFLISGFLVSSSWNADPNLLRFGLRRALRIYPAYACVIILSVLVLGPAVTTLSPPEYLAAPGTWMYAIRNLLIVPVDYQLPGVFEAVPQPGAVNGSLWTIRVEVFCYLLVATLGLLGALKRRWAILLFALGALVLTTVLTAADYQGALIPGALAATAAEPIAYFGIGIVVRVAFPRSRISWPVALAVTALWLACWGTPMASTASIFAVSALTVAVAFRSPSAIQRPTGTHDLSYGVYLLSFPVQQLLAQLGMRSPVLLLGATVGIVVPLALASWKLVERPALHHKPGRVPSPHASTDGPAAAREPRPEARHGGPTGAPSS